MAQPQMTVEGINPYFHSNVQAIFNNNFTDDDVLKLFSDEGIMVRPSTDKDLAPFLAGKEWKIQLKWHREGSPDNLQDENVRGIFFHATSGSNVSTWIENDAHPEYFATHETVFTLFTDTIFSTMTHKQLEADGNNPNGHTPCIVKVLLESDKVKVEVDPNVSTSSRTWLYALGLIAILGMGYLYMKRSQPKKLPQHQQV